MEVDPPEGAKHSSDSPAQIANGSVAMLPTADLTPADQVMDVSTGNCLLLATYFIHLLHF